MNHQITKENTQPIIDVIHNNIKEIFPLTVGNKTIEVKNIETVGWDKADPTNYYDIANAKAHDKTYGVNLVADVELSQDGKVIDKKKMKLATAPVMAGDGTFIVGGSQYQVDHQLRLRPGIYSRIKQNGEIEAHVNPNGFKNLRLAVDPATKKLTVNVNQANINAIPVLRILGISDTEIKKSFGDDVYDANIKILGKKGDEEIKRFFKSVHPYDELPETNKLIAEHLSLSLREAKLDPKVTKITLGQEYDHVNGNALLRGFQKVINVSRGTEQPDDRDALAFKTIHSVEDFVNERLKKNKKSIQFAIQNRMRKNDKLDQIMNSGHINQHVFSFFNSAALSEIPSQINPLSVINSSFKTTITGEGGIENAESIMPESQALHPSHLGYLDPINTPESKKIGVTLNLAIGTTKKGNELLSKFRNIKTGKEEDISTIDAYHKVIALPGQELKGQVTAIKHGKQVEVDASEVTHELPNAYSAFTMASQALPAMNHNQGNRAGMASRHINQAISLKHREAPLVQVQSPLSKDMSTEEFFGKKFQIALHARNEDGIIQDITKSHIIFKGDSGKVYEYPIFNNFDLQNKSYLHHEIENLKIGDRFKKGDLIADSNFSKGGVLSLGTNLRTAYMPWKGLNFEDGIVVSESAAKKLTSNHLFQDNIDKDNDSVLVNKRKFVTLYPSKYTKAQLDKISDNGIVKEEVTLQPGDPYALVLHKAQGTQEDLMLNRLHKSLVQPYKDMSKTWEQLTPGKITRSVENTRNVKIHAKYEAPAIIGDKLALRHGNKGVITSIVADKEMPTTKEGRSTEVLISPLSIVTRMSLGQMLENSASKIAEKTGKPYIIENFSKDNQLEKIKNDLKKHNISDTEELFDEHGNSFGQVLVGSPLIEKLFKTAKANVSARDSGAYDIDNKPIKGGEDGSKAIDQLTLYGLLSHGARGIINEVSTVKGDGNAQFWQNLQNGLPIPKPQVPFVYKKFEAMLHAAGINVRHDGSRKILLPLIDSQIDELAGDNEIESFGMLDHNFEPIKDGLFDRHTTGGSNGDKWAKITLAHPLVNPMYENAVKTILGLKDSEFKTIIKLEGGHDKIKGMLANLNVHEQIDNLTAGIKTAPKTKKDKLVKQLKIFKSLDSLKLSPVNAYITSVVPVVPPTFRPIFEIPGGHVQTHSLNNLYRDLGLINNTIKELGRTPELTDALYNSLGAIQGVNNPITKQNEIKGVKGAIQIITGSGSPKYGFFQNKTLRKQQDLSGRATAVLNNNLNMDQIAIPEKIAKVIYKPFAIKELIKNGYSYQESVDHIDHLDNIGKKAVQAAMSDRPVLMNRAPSLHKFSIMAFQPTLTKNLSIEVPGLIVKPFSLDFDGDTLVLHVPATEKARKESFGLMPSKNLYNPRMRTLNYAPDQGAILGLHLLSQTEEGLVKINDLFPKDILPIGSKITKKMVDKILANLAEKYPEKYNEITTKLKQMGDTYATKAGFSLSLADLPNNSKEVNKEYKSAVGLLKSKSLSDEIKLNALLKADKFIKDNALNDKTNNFVTIVASGSRGSSEQIKQMLFAPGVMSDHNGDPLLHPVLTNYSQGMPFNDYWTTLYSARKAALDKQLMTAKPGALNKEVVNTTMSIVISENDCGTKLGIPMNTDDNNLVGRYLTNGTLVNKSNIESIRDKHKEVIVRSPTTCRASHGICQKCFGIDEYGKLPDIGHNVGIKSAQAATEPLTQAAMKTFHMGGTVSGGGGVFGGFEHVNNFLVSPETFKDRATLSKLDGKITSITPGSAGGFHVNVNEQDHFITPGSGSLKVKEGDKVKKGDLLNNGIPHPKEAIHLLGELGGLHKITETLHNIYKNSGISIDRRNLETIVRGMTGFGIVEDEGTHKHFVKGDVVPLSQIYEFNTTTNKSYKLPLNDAFGKSLDENIGSFKIGNIVNSNMIKSLQKTHKEITVKENPVTYERTLLGVQQAPLKSHDWANQLAFRYLKRGLQEGSTYGYSSDVHGYSPIAPFVTGQMEDGPEGRY
jgi:DNA-directed RNA polymerase subunit beta'